MDLLPPDLITPAIPVFVVLMLLEAAITIRERDEQPEDRRTPARAFDGWGYGNPDTAASLSMGLGYVAIGLLWKGVAFAGYLLLWEWTPLDLGNAWWVFVLLFLGDDLAYYWFHRLHHEVRILWASHVVHHSSQRYNLSTALRQTWTPFTSWVFWAPLALLGFHPAYILGMQAVSLLYQFWIHTEAIDRLWAPIELVFNTPSHHRVHHGSNDEYLDRNYGGILIVWDRLFGTFEAEGAQVRYGLTKNIETYNPVRIAFHEYAAIARDVRTAGSWSHRLGYVLRGPGWRPAPLPIAGGSSDEAPPGAGALDG